MSSFSLRPRLLILLHKGRQLLSELQMKHSPVPAAYCFSSPIQWPSQKTYGVKSYEAFVLPALQGRCAQAYIDLSHWQIENSTAYVLPDLNLSFFPPGESEALELTLPGAVCQTFAQGRAYKQVLNYWATLWQCDLEMLGWDVQVQGKGILLSAMSPRAGWNLTGSFTADSEVSLPLPTAFSSWEHQSGETPFLIWGPYEIGSRVYSCQIPYVTSLTEAEVQDRFQNDLRRQGFAEPILWEDGHLRLELPMGVLVKSLPQILSGHAIYTLDLQDIKQKIDLSFSLNGQRYSGFDSASAVSEWLSMLEPQATAQGVSFDVVNGQLCLRACDLETPLKLSDISPQASQYLGLTPLDLDSPEVEYNRKVEQVAEWLGLARQYIPLLAAEPDLQAALAQLSQQETLFQTDAEAWVSTLSAFLDVLDHWMLMSDQRINPLWHLERADIQTSTHSPQVLTEEKIKQRPSSQFDHKI